MRIDMEKDRKLLGLPPKEPLLPRWLKLFLAMLTVTLLCSLIGALLHNFRLDSGRANLALLLRQMQASSDPAEVTRLAEAIRGQTRSTTQEKLLAGAALSYAAEFARDRTLLLQEALFAFQSAREIELAQKKKPQALDPSIGMHISGILFDLGQERQALEIAESLRLAFERGEWEEYADTYDNLMAYIYASATSPHIRNGQKALELIQRVVNETTDENAVNPAFLDTLAESFYAAGKPDEAVATQKKALAYADAQSLYTYLSHYEKYAKAINAKANPSVKSAPAKNPTPSAAPAPAKTDAKPQPAPAPAKSGKAAEPAKAPGKPAAAPAPAPGKPAVAPAKAPGAPQPIPAAPAKPEAKPQTQPVAQPLSPTQAGATKKP